MMMFDLDKSEVIKKFGTPGSAQQMKWIIKYNDKTLYIKKDSKLEESIREVSVSRILECVELPVDILHYDDCICRIDGAGYRGCYSESYLKQGVQGIALYYFIQYNEFPRNMPANEMFEVVINAIHGQTGINIAALEDYLKAIMAIDFIMMNTDRHFGNIEFITDGRSYDFTPVFDFGKSLLAGVQGVSDIPMKIHSRDFKSLPFSREPKKNLIDLQFAKSIAARFNIAAREIEMLDIPQYFKYIVMYRVRELLSMQ